MSPLLPLPLTPQIRLNLLVDLLLVSADLHPPLLLLLNVLFHVLLLNTNMPLFTIPMSPLLEPAIPVIPAFPPTRRLTPPATMSHNITPAAPPHNPHPAILFIVVAILSIHPVIMLPVVHTISNTIPPPLTINKLQLASHNPAQRDIIPPIAITKAT